MAFLPPNARLDYRDYQASLPNGNELDSGWIDLSSANKYLLTWYADSTGLDLVTESRDDASQTPFSNSFNYSASALFLGSFPRRQTQMRFRLQNNTGVAVTNISLAVASFTSGDQTSVFPLSISPREFSGASLTQSVLTGKDPFNNFQNVGVNEVGSLLTSAFGLEVSRGLYPGYSIGTKFGRNPDVDPGTPEDMWNGGSLYTGFNATAAEELAIVSSDADDTGAVVSSGTATGGSSTTLVDTGATFISDGVAVGDIVLNDTNLSHGYITNVDSETQVTVFQMSQNAGVGSENDSGDDYRIATATDTGAAVIEISQILDADLVAQPNVFVVLNGTTTVTTSGVSAMRCTRAKVLLAGSSGLNEGTITINQATTTANVFAVMPTTGQTTIGAYTVPAGKTMAIRRIRATITRTSGSAGSATIVLFVRDAKGGAFRGIRVFEQQTGAPTEFTAEGAIILPQGTDIKYRITDVSDSNTVAEGAFEFYLIDN